jgi:hypothetical protein
MGPSIHKPIVVVVGGFLGAGKTTLLLAAAKELGRQGIRSAIILNDQGESLVDSEFAELQGSIHAEVTGGCFCCRFSDLSTVLRRLLAFSPHVIFAEPVGSCADISATTLQPLRAHTEYEIAPFTVLVDPGRAAELMRPGANRHLRYLFIKQLEEADIVCYTKADKYPDVSDVFDHSHGSQKHQLSAATGHGVSAWLDEVLSGRIKAGGEILDIDYQQYARAEAALVWLNLSADIEVKIPASPAALLGPFFEKLDEALSASGVGIVHMKAIMQCPTGYVKAWTCGNGEEPTVDGNCDASPAARHSLTLNLRALGEAHTVRSNVEHCLATFTAQISNRSISCFHPAAPKPQHRFAVRLPDQDQQTAN